MHLKIPRRVRPLSFVFLLCLLWISSPACGGTTQTGTTTPASGGNAAVPLSESPGKAPGETTADPGEEETIEAVTEDSPQEDADADNPPDNMPGKVAPVDTPPEATGSGSLSSEEQALLKYHNRVRADVKVAALVWSDKLKGVAAAWGQKLVAKGCVMEHSQGSGYGENLYMGSAEVFTMEDAAKSWESEKKHYTGAALNESNWYKAGHYTQMVWNQTTEVGCAKVTCKGSLIVICNYNPPGNFMGQKAY